MRKQLAVLTTAAVLVGLAPFHAEAQNARTANNAIFIELGGNAVLYSINYERILPQDVGLRAGFSYLSVSASSGTVGASSNVMSIPLTASYLGLGSGSSKLELGGGVLLARFSEASTTGFGDDIAAGAFVPLATFIAGYRYVPSGGGFNFKLGFTPAWHPDVGFFPWGGMAFGFGF